jgi:hypothetical protein
MNERHTLDRIRRLSEPPQRVLLGYADDPLLVKITNPDGSTHNKRIVNPEGRSFQLPTRVYWDRTITKDDESVIRDAFQELFEVVHLDQDLLSFMGTWREPDYLGPQRNLIEHKSTEWQLMSAWDNRMNGIKVTQILNTMLINNPKQIEIPQWEVIFTNYPISEGYIGTAQKDLGAVISFARFNEKVIPNPHMRKETQKTEIFHEFGHVLGLPTVRRGIEYLQQTLGWHCQNKGCVMRQGLKVPDDWIRFTRERLTERKNGAFCPDCQTDLKMKFTRIPKNTFEINPQSFDP